MVMKRKIIIASFGDRDSYIGPMLSNVGKYWKDEVLLITDRERKLCRYSSMTI